MEEWKEYRLGDIATIKGGKRLPKGVNLIKAPNNHPYIRVQDLGHEKTLELNSSYAYVDDETQKFISKYIVNLKSATPFPKCYLHKEKWTFDS